MTAALLGIGPEPLNVEQIAAALAAGLNTGAESSTQSGQDGAVVTFLGLVRNHNMGRSVRYLEFGAESVRAHRR